MISRCSICGFAVELPRLQVYQKMKTIYESVTGNHTDTSLSTEDNARLVLEHIKFQR